MVLTEEQFCYHLKNVFLLSTIFDCLDILQFLCTPFLILASFAQHSVLKPAPSQERQSNPLSCT